MENKFGFVSLSGRTNVGKSTLLNSFFQKKIAITSRKPQTTRNRILGILTEKKSQIVFLDTPGVHLGKPAFIWMHWECLTCLPSFSRNKFLN